ncbi:hypothetical protein K505DRAFT_54893 [Melanomma pulvis-pyrius CBS 109.77]|uniref:Uncharacterized protein n=1 Tax=Melanomma pulvis-pyrius CBS 109.77 TaxID=1314802 RepID=A0A6A6X7I9_9PLEO|nr:hypothetical protein K505DRAFT_54893 [Melanomma pulvis-pyrius CBS 109.77]
MAHIHVRPLTLQLAWAHPINIHIQHTSIHPSIHHYCYPNYQLRHSTPSFLTTRQRTSRGTAGLACRSHAQQQLLHPSPRSDLGIRIQRASCGNPGYLSTSMTCHTPTAAPSVPVSPDNAARLVLGCQHHRLRIPGCAVGASALSAVPSTILQGVGPC